MATPTYTPLANITLGSSAASVTFSSISQAYRDLVLVFNGSTTGTNVGLGLYFNTQIGADYPQVWMQGNGSTATSSSVTDYAIDITQAASISSTEQSAIIFNVFDYSATDKHKTSLVRSNNAGKATVAIAGRWAYTTAITSMTIYANGHPVSAGSTFALFGVAA
jgi:hypothetical protein